MFTLRMDRTSSENRHSDTLRPPYASFVAAGFMFAHSSFLRAAPPDPFMPYVFMGEEISTSIRLWTAGFDIYAPSVDVIRHEYVRSEHPKFWETVNWVFDGDFHNPLNRLLVHRVLHLLGASSFKASDETRAVLIRASEFGLGKVRTRAQYLEMAGLDIEKRQQVIPEWCSQGQAPGHAIEGKPGPL